MSRLEYFVKRFLLIVPTFIGITFACFAICQFVPGGPIEQAITRMRGVAGAGGETGAAASARGAGALSEEQLRGIREYYHFDKPILTRYWLWLWNGKLGLTSLSYKYPNKTVWQLIVERFPISLAFGVPGLILSYLVCIPLGIGKALRNGSAFDVGTSVLVFIGYSIPAFAFGMILKMLLCGTVPGFPNILPHAGFVSENHDALPFLGRMWDIVRHMVLPVLCYMIGDFALLTLLMKNSLLEEISKDYARTARAKGCTVRRMLWVHVLRNSLIPIVTGIGGVLTIMFAGSVLIEMVFEIDGMGRLGIEAIHGRDYMVFMGILSVTSVLTMIGNIVQDFCYVLIDPRIDFAK